MRERVRERERVGEELMKRVVKRERERVMYDNMWCGIIDHTIVENDPVINFTQQI